MRKLKAMLRRFSLGDRYKHQYTCHRDFAIQRRADHYSLLWKGRDIATVGKVSHTHGKYSGACFIVATGPSLAEVDFGAIAHHDCISLNCAIKKLSSAGIRPAHCVIVDRRIFENQWACVRDSILSGANCFFSYVGLSRICEREPELLRTGNIYLLEGIEKKFGMPRPTRDEFRALYGSDPEIYTDETLARYGGTIGFSSNADKGFFPGKTVATWAVQLAHYLGYEDNFILGMDLGGTGKKHFYADQQGKPPDFLRDYEPYIRACFEQARRAADREGFRIYNLSAQSTLPDEIIPKITLDRALQLAAATAKPT